LSYLFFLILVVFPPDNRTQSNRHGKRVPIRVLLAIPRPMRYHAHLERADRAPYLNPQQMTPALNATRIYVDADACPVKDEIYRVAARHGLPVSVVAGNFIRVPQDPLIERIAAGSAMDAADDWIAERAGKGDIVVTSDIPLASRCVKAGCEVIAPNGKPFTEQSIGMTLAVRNLMTDLRSSGEVTGGPKSFAPRDRSAFLSALDQTIRRIQRERANQPVQKQS
jgi:uncharacterized protein YaiI (UPF0178 family)